MMNNIDALLYDHRHTNIAKAEEYIRDALQLGDITLFITNPDGTRIKLDKDFYFTYYSIYQKEGMNETN